MDIDRLTQPELHRLRGEALAAGDEATASAVARAIAARRRRYFTGEMLDVYDDGLRHTGVKERGLVHLDGDWHRTFHCWVVSPRRGTLLVQRRAAAKRAFPGALDCTVGGHCRAGEGVAEACREGREEIGLDLLPERLIPLGRSLATARHGILIDREIADEFLYPADVPLAALRPDPAELAGILELDVAAALALFRGEIADAPATGPGGAVRVRAAEFPPAPDRYYARLALQAGRVVAGQTPLYI